MLAEPLYGETYALIGWFAVLTDKLGESRLVRFW